MDLLEPPIVSFFVFQFSFENTTELLINNFNVKYYIMEENIIMHKTFTNVGKLYI